MYKVWPPSAIDHINGDRDDNRIENLRLANSQQNQANSKVRTNNKSGFKGASLHSLSGLYMSRIMVDGKTKLLGYFKTPEEANVAYTKAAKEAFGEFSNGG